MIFFLLLLSSPLPADYVPESEVAPILRVSECIPHKELYTGFRKDGLSRVEARRSAFHASKGDCYQ